MKYAKGDVTSFVARSHLTTLNNQPKRRPRDAGRDTKVKTAIRERARNVTLYRARREHDAEELEGNDVTTRPSAPRFDLTSNRKERPCAPAKRRVTCARVKWRCTRARNCNRYTRVCGQSDAVIARLFPCHVLLSYEPRTHAQLQRLNNIGYLRVRAFSVSIERR